MARVINFYAGSFVGVTNTSLSGLGIVTLSEGADLTLLADQPLLDSASVFNASGGSLTLNAAFATFIPALTIANARLTVSAATTFAALGGISVGTNATVAVNAATEVAAGATCLLTGGAVTVGAAGSLLLSAACTQTGGNLSGAGGIVSSGGFAVSGGSWLGAGITTFSSTLDIAGALLVARTVSHAQLACARMC